MRTQVPSGSVTRSLGSLGLARTVSRFPVQVTLCVTTSIFLVSLVYRWIPTPQEWANNVAIAFVVAGLAGLTAQKMAESRGWRPAARHLAGVTTSVLSVGVCLTHDPEALTLPYAGAFLAPGTLMLFVAVVLGSGKADSRNPEDAGWATAFRAGLAFCLASVFTLIVLIGWLLLLLMQERFLSISLSSDDYFVPVLLAVFLVGPIGWLSLLRRNEEELAAEAPSVPNWAMGVIAFLIPLALCYLATIYAIVVRAAIVGALPEGEVAMAVAPFLVFALAVRFACVGAREAGPVHVRWFWRWGPAVLVLPALLLVAATIERIAAYGLTEPRMLLLVVGLWMSAVTVTEIHARLTIPPRWQAASLGLLLTALSFGPWSATNLSLVSQRSELTTLLDAAEAGPLDRLARDRVHDIENFFLRRDAEDWIAEFKGRIQRAR